MNKINKTIFVFLILMGLSWSIAAQDSVCARVKIQILQELTLERQAFDARMKITNGLTQIPINNVMVEVNFADEAGNPIIGTSDPNNLEAKFFIRVDSLNNISDVAGSGVVAPSTSAEIHWLIIPAPGTGGEHPDGVMYFVGATLTYTLSGEEQVTEVTPDYIFVKPMPELHLDYFLPNEVYGDFPFTQEIEPEIPFNLGVRVKNTGFGPANKLKIDSGQPTIVENDLGLLINFVIHGSEVNGLPATNSLLADFGDIQPATAGVARWIMTCSLYGHFVEFTAEFSHSDALGGELTSLIPSDGINTHLMVHDVLVDLNGRDAIRDFLAKDGDVYNVYESETLDSPVMNVSGNVSMSNQGTISHLTVPVENQFIYARLTDPHAGNLVVTQAIRADGKVIKADNIWLSQTRDGNAAPSYFLHLFDFNGEIAGGGTVTYTITFAPPPAVNQPPVLQFISNKVTTIGYHTGFLVAASDPQGNNPELSVDFLPGGANFTDHGDGTGSFSWIPGSRQTGAFYIPFNASDGQFSDSRTVRITVLGECHYCPVSGDDTQPFWDLRLAAATLNGVDLQINDEIAIYDEELLVGSFSLTEVLTPERSADNILTAWSVLSAGPGYTAGHSYTIKCWSEAEQTEYNGTIEFLTLEDSYSGPVFPSGVAPFSLVNLRFGSFLPEIIVDPLEIEVECDGSTELNVYSGVTADDSEDGDLTGLITLSGAQVVPGVVGDYVVVYSVTDSGGNTATASRTYHVVDHQLPILSGVPSDITVESNAVPAPASVSASDICDANVNLVYEQIPDVVGDDFCVGLITRKWTAMDSSGNTASASQIISVIDATTPEIHLLNSDIFITITATALTDTVIRRDVTALDRCAGDLTSAITYSGAVDTTTMGSYVITYNVSDSSGNAALPVTRTYHVIAPNLLKISDLSTAVIGSTVSVPLYLELKPGINVNSINVIFKIQSQINVEKIESYSFQPDGNLPSPSINGIISPGVLLVNWNSTDGLLVTGLNPPTPLLLGELHLQIPATSLPGDFWLLKMFNVSVKLNQSGITDLVIQEGRLSIPEANPNDLVIPAGVDLFYTHNFIAEPINALVDFSGNPIPAGFFAPGSQPFSGTISLVGTPINPELWGNADTLIKRNATAILPAAPSSAVIPVELLDLSLHSESPITIIFDDSHQELWNVSVSLSPLAASTGQLTLDRSDVQSGTLAMSLQVHPQLIFNRTNDNTKKTLDFLMPPSGQQVSSSLVSTITDVTWSSTLNDLRLIHSGSTPNYFPDELYLEGANEFAQHFLSPALPDEEVLIWKLCMTHGNEVGELCQRVFDGAVIGRHNGVKKLRVEFHQPLDADTVSTDAITVMLQSALPATIPALQSIQVLDDGYTLEIILNNPLPNQNYYRIDLSAALRYADGNLIIGNRSLVLGVLTGDTNQNGTVNSGDLGLILVNRDVPVTDVSAFLDINRDGRINVGDVVMLKYYTGMKLPTLINPAPDF